MYSNASALLKKVNLRLKHPATEEQVQTEQQSALSYEATCRASFARAPSNRSTKLNKI